MSKDRIGHLLGCIREGRETLTNLEAQLGRTPKRTRGIRYLHDRIRFEKWAIEHMDKELKDLEPVSHASA